LRAAFQKCGEKSNTADYKPIFGNKPQALLFA